MDIVPRVLAHAREIVRNEKMQRDLQSVIDDLERRKVELAERNRQLYIEGFADPLELIEQQGG